MDKINNNTLAIIGCGPRGLSALESLFQKGAELKHLIRVLLFEPFEYPGAGPVYDLDQTDSNWLNVTNRALDVPGRPEISFSNFKIPAFPTFQEWSGYVPNSYGVERPDSFPLRSELGAYLLERYLGIVRVLREQDLITVIKDKVIKLEYEEGLFQVFTKSKGTYGTHEVVLAIGHQPTFHDDQIEGWIKESRKNKNIRLLISPYPEKKIMKKFKSLSSNSVGIRGFGLAMIDLCRILTEGYGGKFELMDKKTHKFQYHPSGNEPRHIVPFSLDGLPMAPKPLNPKVDSFYEVSEAGLSKYAKEINKVFKKKDTITSHVFLIKAISPLIADKFIQLKGSAYGHNLNKLSLISIIERWLLNEDFEHELILSKKLSAEVLLQNFVAMATHTKKVSLDFCIGHVWRHCQPKMYKKLSFAPLGDDVIAQIVELDERLKRYSYGPPIDSLQQLLALKDAGILKLDLVNNPKIKTLNTGWELEKNGARIITDTMINSVLPPPKLKRVKSALVQNLLREGMIRPLHTDLAIETKKDGTVICEDKTSIPLAILGRLAKGTLIGVDAIAECFGIRSKLWANGVYKRLGP